MSEPAPKRPWKRAFLVLAVLAVLGIGTSAVMFASWTTIRVVGPARIEGAFAEVPLLDARPYVTIDEQGHVGVDRSIEVSTRSRLAALHVMTWDPGDEELVRMDLPFWFVKMKMTGTLNLGTIATALSRDWSNLDLDVTEDDLEFRGPGLVLDHTRDDGRRILVWTSLASGE